MTRAESKMSDAERRLRIAMLDQKVSRNEVAQAVGLKITTLGNIIRGACCSGATKRRLTQYRGRTNWRDTPFERHFEFGPHVQFEFPSTQAATQFTEEWSREFSIGGVFREGRTVSFRENFEAILVCGNGSDVAEEAS